MSAESKCIFWNRREGASSDIGPDLTQYGTDTRVPVKFNNGYKSLAVGDYEEFTEVGFNPNNFAIGMWATMDIGILDGYVPSVSYRTGWWQWGTGDDYVKFGTLESLHKTRLYFNIGDVATIIYISTGFTLVAGIPYHVLVVHNRDGIEGTERIQVFLNGVKVFTSPTQIALQPTTNQIFNLNKQNTVPTWYFRGAQDNVKIYSNITNNEKLEILANRENEEFTPYAARSKPGVIINSGD